MRLRTIAVCGLRSEAAAIRRGYPAIEVLAGGGDAARLERELDALLSAGPALVFSSGLAGGLDPALPCGAIVLDGDAALVEHLMATLPGATRAPVTGQDVIAADIAGKAALRQATGAGVVDMESHIAARVARRHGAPFAAIRVISDTASDALPPAALVGMRPDGGIALGAVLASLARRPAQLPALIRTGRQAGLAHRTLRDVYDALGRSGIFLRDLGEFTLEMR
ncbi:phosphorylase [Novosphingobium sp.]|uniref:phosphorylase family protein n=1 Tax=Novosphingobium sp. TaxID=1874826 RepID=UPI003BAD3DAB